MGINIPQTMTMAGELTPDQALAASEAYMDAHGVLSRNHELSNGRRQSLGLWSGGLAPLSIRALKATRAGLDLR